MGVDGCTCGRPKSYSWFVECLKCNEWYHGGCVELKGEAEDEMNGSVQGYCDACVTEMNTKTRCMLLSCDALAAPGSKFCGSTHATVYFKKNIQHYLDSRENETLQLLKCKLSQLNELSTANDTSSLKLKQNLPPVIPSASFPPIKNPPMYTSTPTEALDLAALQILQRTDDLRESTGLCGFSTAYLGLARGETNVVIDEKCECTIKECISHKDWPEMIQARMKNAALKEEERSVPNVEWLRGGKSVIEPGAVRIHTAMKMETKHFIPYVWDTANTEYFLDM